MIVRQLDADWDWTFGQGTQNYSSNNDAVAQNIQTRLKSFFVDCFFDLAAGVNWEERLGSKNQDELLKSDCYNIIKDTEGVLGILQHELVVVDRRATITTRVQTSYGELDVETTVNG